MDAATHSFFSQFRAIADIVFSYGIIHGPRVQNLLIKGMEDQRTNLIVHCKGAHFRSCISLGHFNGEVFGAGCEISLAGRHRNTPYFFSMRRGVIIIKAG